MRIALLGFGDASNGDAAIAVEVISRIDRMSLPEDVLIINGGTEVLKSLESVSGLDGLVIVDAASMGESPGTIKVFDLNRMVVDETAADVAFHGMNFDTELLVANKFMNLPPTTIVGIEPQATGRQGLSDTLKSNIERYVDEVTKAVSHLCS